MVKMPFRGSRAAALLHFSIVVLLMMGTASCLVRRRVLTRKGAAPTQTLLTAAKQTLIEKIAEQYAAVNSLSMTLDMVPAVGTANKGKITEYKDVRAYILFRKPSAIRIIGLYPVVRNKAFDMVSDGSRFRLYIPARNRFIEGVNQIEKPSPNKLENLRPQHFLEALLPRPIDAGSEETTLENFTDEDDAAYILLTFTRGPDGQLILLRQFWFDRLKLQLVRQLIFDPAGDILTDARYSDWQRYDGVPFPKEIEINRPQDEYGVVMKIVKADINAKLTDVQFTLEPPAGTQLETLGQTPPAAPAPAPAPAAKKGTRKK
jgi:outer membrane lipoprotein-sorting protein